MYYDSHSQRTRNDRLTLNLTPHICILFFNNFILVRAASYCQLISPFDKLLSELPEELRNSLKEGEESLICTDALRAVLSGLKILKRI